jgi:imidazolonepropionase-like amidohydrolase
MLFALIFVALHGQCAFAQRPSTLDLVLVGGRVIDPETNLDAVRTVGIKDGRIVSLAEAVPAARDTINVKGLVVAPGFIDLHSHGQDSINYQFLARDGVTTALELEIGTFRYHHGMRSERTSLSSTTGCRQVISARAELCSIMTRRLKE